MLGRPLRLGVDDDIFVTALAIWFCAVACDTSRNLDFGGTATTTLNNAGTINVRNNADLQFQNTVINRGDIDVNAGTSSSDIEIDALGASLDGRHNHAQWRQRRDSQPNP